MRFRRWLGAAAARRSQGRRNSYRAAIKAAGARRVAERAAVREQATRNTNKMPSGRREEKP